MIRTITSVIRGEGIASALRRAEERIGEALRRTVMYARGTPATLHVPVLNVSATPVVPRLGGVQIQLLARLREERALRDVALLQPGVLGIASHARRMRGDFEASVREALSITGARAVHLEGTYAVPIASVLRLVESGVRVIVSVHDFSLVGNALAREMLAAATEVIFPSHFLAGQHRELFDLPQLAASIVEPGLAPARVQVEDDRRAIAYAGSVKRHKGAHLLPDIMRGAECHVFGGGDEDLLRMLRRTPNFHVHGYYRAGTLPSLLARHRIGLVLLLSIVPESFGLTLSESWLAGAAAAAFDLGAPGERIRREGGGWLAPIESEAAGLAEIVERWTAGQLTAPLPRAVPSAADAAKACVGIYRRLGLLD